MADDRDKEAPDVMENHISMEDLDFSVTVIKREVLNVYDSEFESTTSSVQDRKPIFQEEIIPNTFEPSRSQVTANEGFQNKRLNCNKIILGSKPNSIYDDHNYAKANDEFSTRYTKLEPDSVDENYFEELVTSYKPKVELHDIQSYLLKSKRFCETCGILFPETNTFQRHVQHFHNVTRLDEISYKNSDLTDRRIYKCTICDKKFVAPHVLRTHLRNIHRLNNEKVSQTTKHRYKRALDTTMSKHRCTICAKNFAAPHVLRTHLINIHKLKFSKVPPKQKYQSNMNNATKDINGQIVNNDKSNTCFHCKKTFDSQKSLIDHLYDILQMKRKNTEMVPVLKSTLFKCNKCDIHFTSSQFAGDHAEHMEMLINWKCTICNRIFKKEDALSHERQHSVSNNFLVYNLEDLNVNNILFKCSKCAIHFTESNFLYHFRDCSLEVAKYVNCKICNLSLDYNLKALHEFDKHSFSDYTLIETDVISDNPVKCTANKQQTKENVNQLLKSFLDVKVVLEKIDSNKLNKSKPNNLRCRADLKPSLHPKRNLTYYHCETCKCFVTKTRKFIHLEGRCKKFSKITCKYCGLMFTKLSMITHRRLHEETKDLTLKNVKFFNLYNGQPMIPPELEALNIKQPVNNGVEDIVPTKSNLTYYYCETCKCAVTNFKKKCHLEARCKDITKMTCKLCGLKFTKNSMMTHRRLHEERKDLTLKDFKFFNLYNGQPMIPPELEALNIKQPVNNGVEDIVPSAKNKGVDTKSNLTYYYCETCKCAVTNFKKKCHLEARCKDITKMTCKLCGLKFTKNSMMTHSRLHEERKDLSLKDFKFFNLYNGQSMNLPAHKAQNIKRPVNIESEVENIKLSANNKDWHTRRNLTYYYCETCKCAVTKFKKNVHLEGRCKKFAKATCKHCGLMFTNISLITHLRLHDEKKDLTLKNFKFFNLYNGRPTKPPICEIVTLKRPINSEYEVVNGDKVKNENSLINTEDSRTKRTSKLTYFYCESCKCSVTKFRKDIHLKARCKKLAKATCKHCGLMFTTASLITHLRLHEERKELSLKNFTFFNLNNGLRMSPPVRELVSSKQPGNSESEVADVMLHVNNENLVLNRPPDTKNWRTRLNGTYYYCETCKCCVTTFRKDVHLKARCKKMAKAPCELCGLMFTTSSLMTHKRLHKKKKDISLKDFKFFNLYNGQPMPTPEPQVVNIKRPEVVKNETNIKQFAYTEIWQTRRNLVYYYCETCKCFVTKFRKGIHLKALCNKLTKTTCKHCGLMFTQQSIITHMRLHEEKRDLSLKNFKLFNLYNGQPMDPPLPEIVGKATKDITAEVENKKQLVNVEALVENIKRLFIVEAKPENVKQPVNNEPILETINKSPKSNDIVEDIKTLDDNEANFLHFVRPMNIEAEVENLRRLVNNEAQDESVKQPIIIEDEIDCTGPHVNNEATDLITNRPANIEVETKNVNKLEKKEAGYEHLESPINMEAAVTNTKRLENSEAQVENVKKPVSIDAEILCIGPRVNNKAEVLNTNRPVNIEGVNETIKKPKNDEAEFENIVSSINIEAAVRSIIGLLDDEDEMDSLETPVNSEPVNINNPIKSDYPPNNEDEFKNQPVENQAQTEKTLHVNVEENVTKCILPSNIEDCRKKFNMKYYYCESCQCFITQFRKNTHLQARCKNLAKTTCKYCGLMFTSGSMMTHIRLHEEKQDFTLDKFQFFNLYTGQPVNPIVEAVNTKLSMNHKADVVNLTQPSNTETEALRTKILGNSEDWRTKLSLSLYYCETCKCFVTKYKKEIHLQARCKTLAKSLCKHCGLTLTSASMVTHKRLHEKEKGYTVNNFKFFNLYNGLPMNPILENVNSNKLNEEGILTHLTNYYCEICKCFVTKDKKAVHLQSRCKILAKIPCKHCGLILSSSSFAVHKSLHEIRKDLTLKNFKFLDLYNGQPINPPIPEYPKCAHCEVHFLTVTAKNSHICKDVSSLTCHICEIKLSEAAFKLHMTFHLSKTDNTKTMESNDVQSAVTLERISNEKTVTPKILTKTSKNESHETHLCNQVNEAEAPLQSSSDMYSIVYTCRNCSVSVDTYDKAVEHSQRHYETEKLDTKTMVCNYCDLNIDEVCYVDHQILHEKGNQIIFLHFDSYYLPAENNLWTKHLFKTLPNDKVLEILNQSVYRFECRIKMKVVQKGDPNLTVYRCDQCSCFIDPSSLFMHSDNACFKLRNHPCTVCGIPFNSSAARTDHEKIHNRPGLTTESYRIVVFNREQDLQVNRSFCLRKNYVLYKCRNCDVIVDKLQEGNHQCDFTNVEKCPDCGLLLLVKNFESHMNTHKDFISFNYRNMKIILLGEANSMKVLNENNLRSNFKGAVYDYKMVVCNKCEICIRNEECMPKHICRLGKQRSKCLTCGLYFSIGRLKPHIKCHEQDPDFVRSNMNIMSFDPSNLDQNKNTTKLYSKNKNCELSDSNTDSDLETLGADDASTNDNAETVAVGTETVIEETTQIYKCTCGLNFLNKDSIFRHFGTCRSNSKISKLKCQECDLLFTPNVLFTHLLAHHNNKGLRYKYDIIEIDNNQGMNITQ